MTPLQDTSAQDAIDRQEDFNALRIQVAELCGWTKVTPEEANGTTHFAGYYQDPAFSWRRVQPWQLTDYPRDLNACHEFECELTEEQWERYETDLWAIVAPGEMVQPAMPIRFRRAFLSATAEDRCHAFVKTMT